MMIYAAIGSLGFALGWVLCAVLMLTHRNNLMMEKSCLANSRGDRGLLETGVSQARSAGIY